MLRGTEAIMRIGRPVVAKQGSGTTSSRGDKVDKGLGWAGGSTVEPGSTPHDRLPGGARGRGNDVGCMGLRERGKEWRPTAVGDGLPFFCFCFLLEFVLSLFW